jgi:predicted nucleic acid-binding protein
MSGERFTLDTNILVYGMDVDAGDKHRIAAELIDAARHANCVLTLQSVCEFFAATTRRRGVPLSEAAEFANLLLTLFTSIVMSPSTVRMALKEAEARRASYWDALLVATAAEAGCAAILTENMHGGGTLLGVRVVNPFGGGELSAAAHALLSGS